MGLVIIVILISIGLLFVIQFMVLRKPTDTKGTFTQKEMASNTLNAFALTTTECQGLDVTELVQECATGTSEVDCNGDGEPDSCDFVNSLAGDILSKTLKKWGKKYAFMILRGERKLLENKLQGCPGTRDSAIYPVPARYGGERIVMRLDVCT